MTEHRPPAVAVEGSNSGKGSGPLLWFFAAFSLALLTFLLHYGAPRLALQMELGGSTVGWGRAAGSIGNGAPLPSLRLKQQAPPLPPPPPPPPLPPGLPPCDYSLLSGVLSDEQLVQWVEEVRTAFRNDTGQWGRESQRAQLRMAHCALRRFSSAEGRVCLAGRPLVMIGDSVTRYQYLSLIYWLELGSWPQPLRGSPEHKSLVIEKEWNSWHKYYKATVAPFSGRHRCFCARPDIDHIREDRFYTSADGSLAAHFYWFEGYPLKPLHGVWSFPPFGNSSSGSSGNSGGSSSGSSGSSGGDCRPGACTQEADWELPLDRALREVIALHKPATLLLNSGLWRTIKGNSSSWTPAFYQAVMSAAQAAVAPQGGRSIWKTTNYCLSGAVQHDFDGDALQAAAAGGWGVLDAWALTRPLVALHTPPYWDKMHFFGYVYEELNQFLLNMIC